MILYSDCIFFAYNSFSEIPYITFYHKVDKLQYTYIQEKAKDEKSKQKYCSVVHNTCICIQTLRREQSQRLRDTEICSSIIPCMRKIRHFCLTLNYPLSNVSSRAVFVFMVLVTYNKHKFKLSPVMFDEYACVSPIRVNIYVI